MYEPLGLVVCRVHEWSVDSRQGLGLEGLQQGMMFQFDELARVTPQR